MLVVLPNKQVSEYWDLFKEVLETSVPITLDMKPNWLTECLYQAMTGQLQCWIGADGDKIYTAFVTKKVVDELTGQKALLVYAIRVFHKVDSSLRVKDMQTFAKIVSEMGIKRITAFCLSHVLVNGLKKAFPNLQGTTFITIPIEED